MSNVSRTCVPVTLHIHNIYLSSTIALYSLAVALYIRGMQPLIEVAKWCDDAANCESLEVSFVELSQSLPTVAVFVAGECPSPVVSACSVSESSI